MGKMNKNILVFGGGLAGMLTALWCQKAFPQENVLLLESSRLGIVGVGEGTVPSIIDFLKSLDIDIFDFISETRGTLKLGIKFENWNGDGKYYYHAFDSNTFDDKLSEKLLLYTSYFNKSVDENQLFTTNILQNHNKVPFVKNEDKLIQNQGAYALHFDAFKVIEYLRKKCKERGVVLYEGTCNKINLNDSGVEKVYLEDGRIIETDFVFDCSGFARRIIGQEFKTPWISYENHIPHSKAIASPVEYKESQEVFPYTRAIAMPFGWIWQIPTMDRIGCGYVFDGDMISEDEAKHQRDMFLGQKTEVKKVVNFNAGRFEKSWVKNCVAMGLSAHFVEPLEATSIWTTTNFLERMAGVVPFLFTDKKTTDKFREEYNRNFKDSNDNTVAFIYFHYLTKRNDSEFWRTFIDKTEIPERLKEVLEHIKHIPIDNAVLERYNKGCITNFDLHSFISVGSTINIKEHLYKSYCDYYGATEYLESMHNKMCQKSKEYVNQCISHDYFLKVLGR